MILATMDTATDSQSEFGLAFETSSALGSVALGCGHEVFEVRRLSGPRMHAVEFLPTIDALCRTHDVRPTSVRRVYVSSGPGSFTGLRIGITAARMMGLAFEADLVSVPTLEVIAQNALGASPAPDRVVVVLDAKRRRVYAASFVRRDYRYVAVTGPVETDPTRFISEQMAVDSSCAVMGEGVLFHGEAVVSAGASILPETLFPPSAETVFRLGAERADQGRFDDRRTLIPTYVRPPEAEEKWQQRHGG